MNDQTPNRLAVPVTPAGRPELLTIAAEAAVLDRAQNISRSNLDRLRLLLGDEAARLQAGRGERAEAADARPSSQPGAGGRGLHVLVVEDRPEVRETWLLLLGQWGHAVTAAKDGPEAIAAAAAFAPDVVLMDIGLPTLDGYEAARRIRRVLGGAGPLFLALTGRGRDADRERSRGEGFVNHLHKPVEPSDLREILVRIASDEVVEPSDTLRSAT